jgi:hypothetical protein
VLAAHHHQYSVRTSGAVRQILPSRKRQSVALAVRAFFARLSGGQGGGQ